MPSCWRQPANRCQHMPSRIVCSACSSAYCAYVSHPDAKPNASTAGRHHCMDSVVMTMQPGLCMQVLDAGTHTPGVPLASWSLADHQYVKDPAADVGLTAGCDTAALPSDPAKVEERCQSLPSAHGQSHAEQQAGEHVLHSCIGFVDSIRLAIMLFRFFACNALHER